MREADSRLPDVADDFGAMEETAEIMDDADDMAEDMEPMPEGAEA